MLLNVSRVRGGFIGVIRSSQTRETIIATTWQVRRSRDDAARDSVALLSQLRGQS